MMRQIKTSSLYQVSSRLSNDNVLEKGILISMERCTSGKKAEEVSHVCRVTLPNKKMTATIQFVGAFRFSSL